MDIIVTKFLDGTYRTVILHLAVSRSKPAGVSSLFLTGLVPQEMQKAIRYSCFLAIVYYRFLQLPRSLWNVSMIDWIINLLTCREVRRIFSIGKKKMFVTVWSPYTLLSLHSMSLVPHILHTHIAMINAAHCWLLNHASFTAISHFDVIMDLQRLTFSHVLKKHLDKSHTDTAAERAHDFKAVTKRWVQICQLLWIWQMGPVVTWLTFVFSYHLRKIASLSST